jgi:hypothetical protein
MVPLWRCSSQPTGDGKLRLYFLPELCFQLNLQDHTKSLFWIIPHVIWLCSHKASLINERTAMSSLIGKSVNYGSHYHFIG